MQFVCTTLGEPPNYVEVGASKRSVYVGRWEGIHFVALRNSLFQIILVNLKGTVVEALLWEKFDTDFPGTSTSANPHSNHTH